MLAPQSQQKTHQNYPKHPPKMLPKASKSLPWTSPGPALDPVWLGNLFFIDFGVHFGVPFGTFWRSFSGPFFDPFPGRPPEPLKMANGVDLERFGVRLVSFFYAFWDPCENSKICTAPRREPHFYCPGALKNQLFSKPVCTSPQKQLPEAFRRLRKSILSLSGDPMWHPILQLFHIFFRTRFYFFSDPPPAPPKP